MRAFGSGYSTFILSERHSFVDLRKDSDIFRTAPKNLREHADFYRNTILPIKCSFRHLATGNESASPLRAGDEIVAYDGRHVASLAELGAVSLEGTPGQSVVVEFKRNGQSMQLAVPRGPLAGVYCGGAPYFTPIRQKSFDFKGVEE